jgi:hypothetical protein
MKFSDRLEKLEHHYEMQPQCKKEKKIMIIVISSFKKLLSRLFSHCNIDKEYLDKDVKYLDLKKSYINLVNNLVLTDDVSFLEQNFEIKKSD